MRSTGLQRLHRLWPRIGCYRAKSLSSGRRRLLCNMKIKIGAYFELHTNCERWYAVCMDRAVACYRVSTKQQHRSGLGIEAQRAAVTRFVAAEGATIIREFVEVETGKGADTLDRRPQLAGGCWFPGWTVCRATSPLSRASWPNACLSWLLSSAPMRTRSCSTSTRLWQRKSAA